MVRTPSQGRAWIAGSKRSTPNISARSATTDPQCAVIAVQESSIRGPVGAAGPGSVRYFGSL